MVMVLAAALPASAQHRARLSTELAKHLEGPAAILTVLVQGPQSEVNRLASTYGLTVTRRLKSGADLTGSVSRIDRLASDPNVDSLREDRSVFGTMAVHWGTR